LKKWSESVYTKQWKFHHVKWLVKYNTTIAPLVVGPGEYELVSVPEEDMFGFWNTMRGYLEFSTMWFLDIERGPNQAIRGIGILEMDKAGTIQYGDFDEENAIKILKRRAPLFVFGKGVALERQWMQKNVPPIHVVELDNVEPWDKEPPKYHTVLGGVMQMAARTFTQLHNQLLTMDYIEFKKVFGKKDPPLFYHTIGHYETNGLKLTFHELERTAGRNKIWHPWSKSIELPIEEYDVKYPCRCCTMRLRLNDTKT